MIPGVSQHGLITLVSKGPECVNVVGRGRKACAARAALVKASFIAFTCFGNYSACLGINGSVCYGAAQCSQRKHESHRSLGWC